MARFVQEERAAGADRWPWFDSFDYEAATASSLVRGAASRVAALHSSDSPSAASGPFGVAAPCRTSTEVGRCSHLQSFALTWDTTLCSHLHCSDHIPKMRVGEGSAADGRPGQEGMRGEAGTSRRRVCPTAPGSKLCAKERGYQGDGARTISAYVGVSLDLRIQVKHVNVRRK